MTPTMMKRKMRIAAYAVEVDKKERPPDPPPHVSVSASILPVECQSLAPFTNVIPNRLKPVRNPYLTEAVGSW